jgi:hypothetical protein
MLGATQRQLFQTQPGADGTTEITGFQPYTPYSTDPSKSVAGFSPLQQQAQQTVAGMQSPGIYGAAQGIAGMAGQQALGTQGQAQGLMGSALGYGQAGAGFGQAGQLYGAQGAQQANMAAQQAQRAAQMYGRQGSMYGAQAAGLAPAAQMYGQGAANIGMQGLGYGAQGAGFGQQAANMAGMGFGAGQQYAQQVTDPNAVGAYMSPYQQQVTDIAKMNAVREAQMAGQQANLGAARQGTYGGARQALAQSEREKNLLSNLSNIQAQGSQSAFDRAIASQQFGANLGLQGLGAGYQGLGMGMQGAQTGLSGLGTAMQGQQAGLSGLGQAGSLYGQGMQGAGVGLSGVGQQLGAGQLGLQGTAQGIQGAQAGMQGAGVGLSGVGQALGAGQYGLQGLGQATQSASTLGALAGQEFGTQKDIIGMQQQAGAQQQQQQQQIVNQAIQDYANAQQYPMMQLGFMSNMLRGLPMQSTNTQQYVAAPNQLTQGIGALGAGANIYSAFQGNPTRVAEGGQIKSYAKGGIASYDVGGNVKSDLSNIRDPEELKEIARNTTSDVIRREALRFAKMREMGLAGGGIVAFREGQTVYSPNKTLEDYMIPDSDELKARREADVAAALALKAERDTQNTPTSSIMFDQMKNRPTSSGIPMLERPENFKVDAVAREPEPKPKKVYERIAESMAPIFAPSKQQLERRGITQAVATKDDVKEKILAPLVKDTVDTSDRNSLGETKIEQANMAAKKDEAPAAPAASAKKDTGIKAVQPPAEVTTSGDRIAGLSPTMQALYDRSTGRQQTIDEIMAEKQAARDKYVGPDTRPEERARLMAEKANMKDEDARNRKLQLAQFFASWGSTPGSTLQAAMVAVNKHIPTIIASDKEARKAQNEVDKIIRELNKAERMEKEGDVEGAFKIKSEQSKKYEELNKTLMTYVGQKEAAAVKATGSDKVTQQKMLLNAQTQLGSARRALTDLRAKNKALYDRAALPGQGKEFDAMRDKAKSEIAALESQHLAQIEEAENTLQALRSQGDIVVPGGEKKSTEVASNTTVKKYNKETGRLE